MLGAPSSSSGQRPPRARPMSARPTSAAVPPSKAAAASTRPELAPSGSDEDEEVVEEDDGDEEDGEAEFGDAAERQHVRQPVPVQQRQRLRSAKQPWPTSKRGVRQHFRPASAPPGRAKVATAGSVHAQDHGDKARRSAAAISISYLRQAAEKKKARDRDFARELQREESEYRKKITLKIEQANKMVASTGSSKSFSTAPDREGMHMIKVADPASGDRVITVEIFLREFEKLATAQLGYTPQSRGASAAGIAGSGRTSTSSSSKPKSSAPRGSLAPRATRATLWPSSSSRDLQAEQESGQRKRAARSKPPTDRSHVQEELKSVLEGTIELSKVLQDQLNELKLKGWNFSSRGGAA